MGITSQILVCPKFGAWHIRPLCNTPWPWQKPTSLHNWYIKLNLMVFVGIFSIVWRNLWIYFLSSVSIYSIKHKYKIVFPYSGFLTSINLTTWGSKNNIQRRRLHGEWLEEHPHRPLSYSVHLPVCPFPYLLQLLKCLNRWFLILNFSLPK